MEIIITALVVIAAVYILYKNLKKKSRGKCDCCSDVNCPHCTDKKKS
ncbi:MAG: FeoB-associated Cys-rich membrane protein [Clostridium luticellarii]|nr:FeoB-associated Cys-rich membrane protein [Clostridium luticellarii]MCI1967628.1 FeoB-associated Cys-rich membrane protein [Clostridium luticellarii]MCI1996370.1 FeoB-associated Cys-rich membrane protein [Clostridium luticellarii]MCI2039937.1 FeoB-associated Cys-rich membrane protein [Clostridium luticellarii]